MLPTTVLYGIVHLGDVSNNRLALVDRCTHLYWKLTQDVMRLEAFLCVIAPELTLSRPVITVAPVAPTQVDTVVDTASEESPTDEAWDNLGTLPQLPPED